MKKFAAAITAVSMIMSSVAVSAEVTGNTVSGNKWTFSGTAESDSPVTAVLYNLYVCAGVYIIE